MHDKRISTNSSSNTIFNERKKYTNQHKEIVAYQKTEILKRKQPDQKQQKNKEIWFSPTYNNKIKQK